VPYESSDATGELGLARIGLRIIGRCSRVGRALEGS
jgi:hypothetical protein